MKNYIYFTDNETRDLFFLEVKTNSGLKWKDIRKDVRVTKGSFERYRAGESGISEDCFYRLLAYIPENSKSKFLRNIKTVNSSLWLVKGGKNAYKINIKKFEEGRKKGIIKFKSYSKMVMTVKKIDFELSQELCEFIGAFIGDGMFNCYKNKLYQIEFAGDSRRDLEYYQEKIIPGIKNVIPNLNPHIYKVKNKNSIRIVFYSKDLFYFLKNEFDFIPGKKTYTVFIPNRIMNSKEVFINAAIRGIFDTEGCIFLDKRSIYKNPYPRISLQIVSEPLYTQLKDYLSKEFKIDSGKIKDRNVYYIGIYGFNQLKKWMSLIGFSNKRHLDKIAAGARLV
jgi:hypothetical protein